MQVRLVEVSAHRAQTRYRGRDYRQGLVRRQGAQRIFTSIGVSARLDQQTRPAFRNRNELVEGLFLISRKAPAGFAQRSRQYLAVSMRRLQRVAHRLAQSLKFCGQFGQLANRCKGSVKSVCQWE